MTNALKKSLMFTLCGLIAFSAAMTVGAESADHSRWDEILKANVNDSGWVAYREIQSEWNVELKRYISSLGAVDAKQLPSDQVRKAFWINAYNAVTIQTLLDEGLPATVPHARFFGKNIFKQENYRIAGKVRSLDEIEHDILRKRYGDPRIHAALVCGASSCPRLRPEPFTADKLDEQLDEEVRIWIQKGLTKDGKRKNYLNAKKGVFYASEIFKWFNEDFNGGGEDGVKKFVAEYLPKGKHQLFLSDRVEVEYLDYDWSLNSQK